MSDRFFIESPIVGETALVTGNEAQHLAKVMRAQVGDSLTLFDGSGAEFLARVEKLGRHEVQVAILERHAIDRELPRDVTLAVALPKGERQQWLVEKLTELGVTRVVPIVTKRGVAQPVDNALSRLRRTVIEASKQCGRNRLLEIAPPQTWTALATQCDAARYLAHPAIAVTVAKPADQQAVVLAVGPEGGWTDEEVALAIAHHWQGIDLGPRILRVETAAIALAIWAAQKSEIRMTNDQ